MHAFKSVCETCKKSIRFSSTKRPSSWSLDGFERSSQRTSSPLRGQAATKDHYRDDTRNRDGAPDPLYNQTQSLKLRPSRQSPPPLSRLRTTSDIAAYNWRKDKSLPEWHRQKLSLSEKHGTQWSPTRRISPDAMSGLRTLHASHPEFTTPRLAEIFGIGVEGVRRVLKAKWVPNEEEEKARAQRWKRRGESIFERLKNEGRDSQRRGQGDGDGQEKGGDEGGEELVSARAEKRRMDRLRKKFETSTRRGGEDRGQKGGVRAGKMDERGRFSPKSEQII